MSSKFKEVINIPYVLYIFGNHRSGFRAGTRAGARAASEFGAKSRDGSRARAGARSGARAVAGSRVRAYFWWNILVTMSHELIVSTQ